MERRFVAQLLLGMWRDGDIVRMRRRRVWRRGWPEIGLVIFFSCVGMVEIEMRKNTFFIADSGSAMRLNILEVWKWWCE